MYYFFEVSINMVWENLSTDRDLIHDLNHTNLIIIRKEAMVLLRKATTNYDKNRRAQQIGRKCFSCLSICSHCLEGIKMKNGLAQICNSPQTFTKHIYVRRVKTLYSFLSDDLNEDLVRIWKGLTVFVYSLCTKIFIAIR